MHIHNHTYAPTWKTAIMFCIIRRKQWRKRYAQCRVCVCFCVCTRKLYRDIHHRSTQNLLKHNLHLQKGVTMVLTCFKVSHKRSVSLVWRQWTWPNLVCSYASCCWGHLTALLLSTSLPLTNRLLVWIYRVSNGFPTVISTFRREKPEVSFAICIYYQDYRGSNIWSANKHLLL